MRSTPRFALALAVGAALAGCERAEPLAPEVTAAHPPVLAVAECTASVSRAAVACRPAAPSTGSAVGLIVGGQDVYVRLEASAISHAAGIFGMDVTVQNLIPQPLGTTDGSALHPDGVRVFFFDGPTTTDGTGDVSLRNPAGSAFFLSAGQPYFEYPEMLAPNQTSGAVRWEFDVDAGVDEFSFLVFVATQVRYPAGWVDVAGTDTLLAGAGAALGATVRTVVGTPVPEAAVEWSSSDAAVVTVDGAGTITAVGPGLATVTATAGARSGSRQVVVCPDLAVGEVYTSTMPAAAATCLGGGAAGAEYAYIPVNLSSAGALGLSVTAAGIVPITGPPSPSLAPGGPSLLRAGDGAGVRVDEEHHLRRMRGEARELAPLIGRASARVSRGARPGGPSRLIVPGVPAVGDLWQLNTASGCSGARDDRTGRVVAVGQHVILVADTMNPAGGFTTAQYDSIALEFDSIAHPAVVDNFGAPTDLDGNGRVVAFYTRAVNELSPPASSAVVLGYVSARDLFSAAPESCPRSNEGEIFYMLVPDPTGAVNSNVRTVSYVRGNTVGTLGHEFQHLVNASRRVYVNEAPGFEEVWLNEGLSHVVEELMFYRTAMGLAPRQNITLSTLTTGPNASRRVAAFNTYANSNFSRMRSWMQRPDTAGPVKNNDVLAVRGAIWGFLRYAADRRGGDDAQLWFDLGNSTTAGRANLQAALGVSVDDWVRDFVSAMYADDAVPGIGPAQQVTSWNFRSVYGGLGGFPLGTRALSNGVSLNLSYSAGGGSIYGRFGVPAGAFASVTALSAGSPPVSPYALIVVRTK